MSKAKPLHTYLINTGTHAGQVVEGFEIGCQMYPDQIKIENLAGDTNAINALYKNGYAVWIPDLNLRLVRKERLAANDITRQGVDWGNYTDLCETYDRNNQKIRVGDMLYVASKNAVREAKVTKIADKPVFLGYGLYLRKLTVRDEVEEQTLTISNSRDTILKV